MNLTCNPANNNITIIEVIYDQGRSPFKANLIRKRKSEQDNISEFQ